jgi:hypothetical protein
MRRFNRVLSRRLRSTAFGMAAIGALWLSGCGEGEIETGPSVTRIQEGLSGCHGVASSSIPASGNYYLTTFGATTDSGPTSCGQNTMHGSWYYAASRQRYGCGSRIKITNPSNGKCVVAETSDYGPDVCVENAAGGPIIDASPLVAEHLFGHSSAGWSDHFRIHVAEVGRSTPLGPCSGSSSGGGSTGGGGTSGGGGGSSSGGGCHSATLDKNVPAGTCVQSASDGSWYHCSAGNWVSGETHCTSTYGYCFSHTLGKNEPARTCVQSRSDGHWYQCTASGWEAGGANGSGPLGHCSSMHAL